MIEQVVEFGDKRVLELMTPRPEIVAISADATIEQMRRLLVETKFSRVIVYPRKRSTTCSASPTAGTCCKFREGEAQRRKVRGNRAARAVRAGDEARLGIAQGDADAGINRWPLPWTSTAWWREW